MVFDEGRRRLRQPNAPRLPRDIPFANPYPWMSGIEARVKIALEQHNIPHSWRYFDGYAPTFRQLMGDTGYQPEFTILELQTVVIVQGAFWGTLNKVVDNVSLASAAFQMDGWKVVILWENDILNKGAWPLLVSNIPNISTVSGPERPNPYATTTVKTLLARRKYRWRERHDNTVIGGTRNGRRTVRRGVGAGDFGRRRLGRIARGEEYRPR